MQLWLLCDLILLTENNYLVFDLYKYNFLVNETKLLLEKRRQGLPETINEYELEMLKEEVPIQKIMGFINFDNLRIAIDRHVLIPRYETQEVINKALEYINEKSKVLDLCTGSGYIGLTIKQKSNAKVIMSDINDEAISQAKINAISNKLHVKIIKSDIFKNINEKFDVIISNPPYIPNNKQLPESVIKFDPGIALFGGEDGNDFYKIIIKEYKKYLNPGGKLILEISEDNVELMKKNNFEIFKDINNKPRIAIK